MVMPGEDKTGATLADTPINGESVVVIVNDSNKLIAESWEEN